MDTVLLICGIVSLLISTATLIFVLRVARNKTDLSGDFSRQREDLRGEMSVTRRELNERLDAVQRSLSASLTEGMTAGNTAQTNALNKLSGEINTALSTFGQRVDKMNETTEKRLLVMQEDNRKKLDEMQNAVNEKLESALEKRVTDSFKMVNDRLEQVYKSLGEMQTLASGVGDLKKILSNVKTRGIFGEVQLSRILEQILSPEQYRTDIATVPGSRDHVEFAVCLPGQTENSVVYLPIDSKFPLDRFEQLEAAKETGDPTVIETARKALAAFLTQNARIIREKYVQPPYTTDFAILFLPTEGLYAEVVQNVALTEKLMREYSVNVAGPSTIAALLNSLQMGFRTLAIEKRTNDVWNVLAAVKTEFGTFESVLESVKKRLAGAGDDLDKLVGTRTRAIRRKLRDVETLPTDRAAALLSDAQDGEENEE